MTLYLTRKECQECGLYEFAEHPCVLGTLPKLRRRIPYVFIGEAPGSNEDRLGYPFVGASGLLLRDALHEVGFKEEDSYITNVVKCALDKAPTAKQVSYCKELLFCELAYLCPENIICLGDTALKVLKLNGSVSSLQGTPNKLDSENYPVFKAFDKCNVFCVYHPAYILRNKHLLDQYKRSLEYIISFTPFDLKSKSYTLCTDLSSNLDSKYSVIAFDLETDGLDGRILSIGFSGEDNTGICVPWNEGNKQVSKQIFESGKTLLVHNIKFEYKKLKLEEIFLPEHSCLDTMCMSILLDENRYTHGLKALAVDIGMGGYEEKLGITDEVKNNFKNIPIEDWYKYNCADVDATRKYAKKALPEISAQGLDTLLTKFTRYQYVLGDMELNGIQVNKELAQKFTEDILQDITWFENNLINHPIVIQYLQNKGLETLNLRSRDQLEDLLLKGFNFKLELRTESDKRYSVGKEVLEELYANTQDEFLCNLLLLQNLQHKYSSFLKPLPGYIKANDKIYCELKIGGAKSGRLSCKNPNLQNQPKLIDRGDKKSEYDKKYNIRNLFIPSEGFKFVAFDYSQLELRVLAQVSQDKNLLQCYKENLDIHQMTADVLEINRNDAKPINFAIPYGGDAYTLWKALITNGYSIPFEKAAKQYDAFMQKFSGIKNYFDTTWKELKNQGYVVNLYGLRRRFPEFNFVDEKKQKAIFRTAVNFKIQGTAAMVAMYAAIYVREAVNNTNLIRIILNIHDELLFEIHESILDEGIKVIKDAINRVKFPIPLPVDCKVGDSWGSLKEYKF